ncbi:MAG: yehT 5 [Mucilaginibacter sp.]|jgi:two-component system LytT family response regulator|nr:yehT 5 [Mucilaginibacter sp.]
MITCIVIDDEAYSIDIVTTYINKTDNLKLLSSYTNSVTAIRAIEAGLKPALIFLDIDMPDLSGFELAALLPPDIAIIYITAFGNYALQSFETNVYDFLLKPISFAKFLKSVNKVKAILEPRAEHNDPEAEYFFINPGVKGKVIKIDYKNIIYIQGLKNYIIIYLFGGKCVTYLMMKEIEQTLPKHTFIRIHKSYIVNVNMIQAIEGNTITLSEHLNLPLGGSYKDSLMKIINKKAVISRRKD